MRNERRTPCMRTVRDRWVNDVESTAAFIGDRRKTLLRRRRPAIMMYVDDCAVTIHDPVPSRKYRSDARINARHCDDDVPRPSPARTGRTVRVRRKDIFE